MKKITILGAGAMGTAFAVPCADNGHQVNIVGTHLEDDFIKNLKSNNNFHPGLNTNISSKINFHKFAEGKVYLNYNIDLLVLGISSKGIDWVAEQIYNLFGKNKIPPILMLTKGLSIHQNKFELLIDKLKRILKIKGIKKVNISAVGGPCLATGLANRIHSSVVIANDQLKQAQQIASMLNNNYYHVYTSKDVVGVEVCAALKNIFSMAIGAAKGISSKEASDEIKEKNYLNTAAALVKQSIAEMMIFVTKMKGNKNTVIELAGLGDLYVSAGGGRNAKMGSYIGDGLTYSEAKKTKMEKVTVEGAELAIEIGKKVNKDFSKKQLPLMLSMINAIINDQKLNIDWSNFK